MGIWSLLQSLALYNTHTQTEHSSPALPSGALTPTHLPFLSEFGFGRSYVLQPLCTAGLAKPVLCQEHHPSRQARETGQGPSQALLGAQGGKRGSRLADEVVPSTGIAVSKTLDMEPQTNCSAPLSPLQSVSRFSPPSLWLLFFSHRKPLRPSHQQPKSCHHPDNKWCQ